VEAPLLLGGVAAVGIGRLMPPLLREPSNSRPRPARGRLGRLAVGADPVLVLAEQATGEAHGSAWAPGRP
jgi:hypothetical protein